MKKVTYYTAALLVMLLALATIQLKSLLKTADDFEKATLAQADKVICETFKESIGTDSPEYASTKCQKLSTGKFEILTTKAIDGLDELVDRNLSTIQEVQLPYSLTTEEQEPTSPNSGLGYNKASLELSLPSRAKFIMNSISDDTFFSFALISAIIILGFKIFRSFKAGEAESSGKMGVSMIGAYTFDAINQRLIYNDKVQRVTRRETELLKCLTKHKNEVIRRDEILITLWGESDYFTSRSLDVFIRKLRNYLSEDSSIEIETVYGVGFVLKEIKNK